VQIRVIRTTLSFVVVFLAILSLAGNDACAEESAGRLRISRPQQPAPVATPATKPVSAEVSSACCGSTACGVDCSDLSEIKNLSSSLPPDGLFARWRAEYVNPTLCPIRLCHGSCARSSMSCKFIKPILDSLLDAYIPEEQPVQALLNFRCCAGFTED
jgi:hypothetical protein